jgi:predicted glutamine amidotransferase
MLLLCHDWHALLHLRASTPVEKIAFSYTHPHHQEMVAQKIAMQ